MDFSILFLTKLMSCTFLCLFTRNITSIFFFYFLMLFRSKQDGFCFPWYKTSVFFFFFSLNSLRAHHSLKYLEELFWNETHFCWIEQMAGYTWRVTRLAVTAESKAYNANSQHASGWNSSSAEQSCRYLFLPLSCSTWQSSVP